MDLWISGHTHAYTHTHIHTHKCWVLGRCGCEACVCIWESVCAYACVRMRVRACVCVCVSPGRPCSALKHRLVSSTITGPSISFAAIRHFSLLISSGSPCAQVCTPFVRTLRVSVLHAAAAAHGAWIAAGCLAFGLWSAAEQSCRALACSSGRSSAADASSKGSAAPFCRMAVTCARTPADTHCRCLLSALLCHRVLSGRCARRGEQGTECAAHLFELLLVACREEDAGRVGRHRDGSERWRARPQASEQVYSASS